MGPPHITLERRATGPMGSEVKNDIHDAACSFDKGRPVRP